MDTCSHLEQIKDVSPKTTGCEECMNSGSTWVNLRICLECGHVGCCDSSIGKHATDHFHSTGHPIMRSFELNDSWGWCYVDDVWIEFGAPFHRPGGPEKEITTETSFY